jgi:predicted Zn-dependent protease
LRQARTQLNDLNKRSSADTEASAARRSRLHIEIAALENASRQSTLDRDRMVRMYDLQITKLWIVENWPDRRKGIQERISSGNARDRQHGDIEDAGYRTIAKDPEKDIETGRQAVRQMLAAGYLPPELRDEDVQSYVQRVGDRIARNSDLKVPLRVSVIDDIEPRAMALPGGFVFITSGVVLAAQSEEELAGVLSREIARIAARHAARASSTSWLSRMFLPVTQMIGGLFAGPASPAAYYGLGYGLQGLSGVVTKALNSDNEELQLEADQLGIQYAWKAGYDPAGFVSFLDSIAGKENKFLSETPELKKRLIRLFDEIEHLPVQKKPEPVSGDFDRIRRRLTR